MVLCVLVVGLASAAVTQALHVEAFLGACLQLVGASPHRIPLRLGALCFCGWLPPPRGVHFPPASVARRRNAARMRDSRSLS